MEKHNKDLEIIKVDKDSLQVTLKQIDANYWKLKTKKNSLSVEHNKLQNDYKNMERIFLKQQKELEELKVYIGNVYQAQNELERQSNQR
jgi:chromosome segregation ATPase